MIPTDLIHELYTERTGIVIHCGRESETTAHDIAALEIVQTYGKAGEEWLRLRGQAVMIDAYFTNVNS